MFSGVWPSLSMYVFGITMLPHHVIMIVIMWSWLWSCPWVLNYIDWVVCCIDHVDDGYDWLICCFQIQAYRHCVINLQSDKFEVYQTSAIYHFLFFLSKPVAQIFTEFEQFSRYTNLLHKHCHHFDLPVQTTVSCIPIGESMYLFFYTRDGEIMCNNLEV